MLNEIQKILGGCCDIDPENINEDILLKDDLGLDTFDIADILNEIEDTFGVTLPEEKASSLDTVRDLVLCVENCK